MSVIAKDQAGIESIPAITIVESLAEVLPVLSRSEADELDSLENIISTGMKAAFQIGRALGVIKAKRLYRGEFATFEAYCKAKWDLNRSHAYRVMDAAKVCAQLSPIGDIPLPKNECQVRPLVGLSPETAKKAWKMALETSGSKAPTGAAVRRAVLTVSRKRSAKAPSQESWQRLVLPLLRSAVKSAECGAREDVEDALHRALLRLGVGKPVSQA